VTNTQLFANNAVSTLAADITPQSTQITIVGATNFPAAVSGASFFVATISNATGTVIEIVNCFNRQGAVLTVLRGQEGTLPVSWPAGSTIYASFTAGTFASFLQGPYVANSIITLAPSGQAAYTYNTYNSAALEAFCVPKPGPGSLFKFRGQLYGSISTGALILGIDYHSNNGPPVNGPVVPDLVYKIASDGTFGDMTLTGGLPWPFNAGINFFLSTGGDPFTLVTGSALCRFEVGFL
jgi:hypothetical protein